MDYLGLSVVVLFYAVVFALGILAARVGSSKPVGGGRIWGKQECDNAEADLLLAGRGLGLWLGICTLVATEVGGAFVNGTAEEASRRGLAWCLAPIGYSLSMALNGFTFAPRLRERGCVTLVDALQQAYGDGLGALVYLPSCVGDVCWTAAVLSALGGTLEALLGVDKLPVVLVSASVAAAYTFFGGMRAVALTDVLQVAMVFVGLWTAVPYVLSSPDVNVSNTSLVDWTGTVTPADAVGYLDTLAMILLGGIPWQPYYQRALALEAPSKVKLLSVAACLLSLSMMVPPLILGVAAKTVVPVPDELLSDPSMALPAVIKNQTPYAVSLVCLSAIR